jgi:hypothetical protein
MEGKNASTITGLMRHIQKEKKILDDDVYRYEYKDNWSVVMTNHRTKA